MGSLGLLNHPESNLQTYNKHCWLVGTIHLDLDSLVSNSLDKRGFIQNDIKVSSNTDRLQALINKADDIINAINNKKYE